MIERDLPIIVAFNKIDELTEKMIKVYRKELKT
jgi:Fe2+ transport system protein B